MFRKKFLLLTVLVLLTSQSVFAQLAYWVNNSGGTRPATVTVNSVVYNTDATTYTDIQTALNQVYNNANGGVIYVTDGRYVNPSSLTTPNTNCNLNVSQDANLSLNLDVYYSGTSVILTSETGDFRTSSAKLVGYGLQINDDNADITIQGLELDSVHVNGLYFRAPTGDYGTTTIKNNKITNTYGHGIKSDSPANWGAWVVEGNCFQNIGYFDSRGNCTTPAPVSAMWLGEPGNLTITNNIIKRVRWAGILLDGYSKYNPSEGTTSTTVSGNYVSDTQDAGIQIGFSTGAFFHPTGVSINNNILKSCNMSLEAGRGAIVLLSSNVEGVSIQNNDISLSHNGIAICIAGWDNSSSTKAINYNNIYNLMGGYGITHIANIAPNGLFGTGDNLSFYNFENNYWGAVDGPSNAGGAGEELMKDAVNTTYSLGAFDYTPFATSANTVTNTTCATCLTVDWYEDTDTDGYGDLLSTTQTSCAWPSGYVGNSFDCDDSDDAITFCPQWTGDVSTDWNVAGNWNRGAVPTSNDRVLVRSAPSNQPHVTSAPGTPAECDELDIESGATLTVDAGKALTVNGATTNAGTILVKADATGIGSLITEGAISGAGASKMEQYLSGSGGATPNGVFYYVGSPVGAALVYDYNVDSGDKLWSADETTQSYNQELVGAVNLSPLEGYVARMGSTQTITFNEVGSNTHFNTGNQSASGLTRTGTTATYRGYNLVGNPYPSTVSWDDAVKTNLETTIWYRTNNAGTMTFDTYNATGSVGTNNNGGGAVTGDIPPTQAVWVRVDADGNTGQVDFTDAMRSHGTLSGIYRMAAEEGTIRLALSNGTISDEQIIMFNPSAMDGYDDYDSQKYWSSDIPQLYTNVAEDTLTINGLSSPQTNPTVPLGMKLPAQGEYTLNATSIIFAETNVYLEDTELNIFQDLNAVPNYAFTSTNGNIADRFVLHFGMSVTGVKDAESMNSRVYAANGQLNVILSQNIENGNMQVLDMAGRTVYTASLNATRTILDMNVNTGVYLVRVETANGTNTHKIILN